MAPVCDPRNRTRSGFDALSSRLARVRTLAMSPIARADCWPIPIVAMARAMPSKIGFPIRPSTTSLMQRLSTAQRARLLRGLSQRSGSRAWRQRLRGAWTVEVLDVGRLAAFISSPSGLDALENRALRGAVNGSVAARKSRVALRAGDRGRRGFALALAASHRRGEAAAKSSAGEPFAPRREAHWRFWPPGKQRDAPPPAVWKLSRRCEPASSGSSTYGGMSTGGSCRAGSGPLTTSS